MQVFRDLDLTASALRQWVERAGPGRSQGQDWADQRRARGVRAAERGESIQLRGAGDSKESRGLLREAPSLRFAFIEAEKARFPVRVLCRTLLVSRAGYYAFCSRPDRRTPGSVLGCTAGHRLKTVAGREGQRGTEHSNGLLGGNPTDTRARVGNRLHLGYSFFSCEPEKA